MRFHELQQENNQLNQIVLSLLTEKAELTNTVNKLQDEEEHLKLVIKKLQHQLYGKSSEKRKKFDPANQMNLFDLPEEAKKEKVKTVEIKEHTREVRKKFEEEEEALEGTFSEDLPHEEQVIDEKPEGVAEEDLELVSTKVTERLASTPEQHRVIRVVRNVYKVKSTGKIFCPPAPDHVLDRRCKVSESFLVLMIIKKFLWHLPLYRQQQELRLQGIKISRESLVRWTMQLAAVLEPIAREIAGQIRGAPVVHVDETPIMVGKKNKDKKKKYSNGQLWPILAEGIGVAFMYTNTRAWGEVYNILKDFKGTLVSDAYDGYQNFTRAAKIQWQLCWMHIRRNFVEAIPSNQELANNALDYIEKLYKIEHEIRNLEVSKKTIERQKRSKPVLEVFYKWLLAQSVSPTVLTDEAMSKAVSYVLKRWEAASLFVQDGAIPIDNGAVERAIRPEQLGAKNWLHCASEVGAETIAIFYTLIGSALMNGIHPYYYLLDLTKRLDDREIKAKDLVPSVWKTKYLEEAIPEHLRNVVTVGSPFVGNPTPKFNKN